MELKAEGMHDLLGAKLEDVDSLLMRDCRPKNFIIEGIGMADTSD